MGHKEEHLDTMSSKRYLSAEQLLLDSFRLAGRVFKRIFANSNYRDMARRSANWYRCPRVSRYCGIEIDHIAIRTSSYGTGIDERLGSIRVHGLNYLVKNVTAEDKLLIVDDVFDTGRTVDAVICRLSELARLNTPSEIRIAVPYYKPSRREVDRIPEYYLEKPMRG